MKKHRISFAILIFTGALFLVTCEKLEDPGPTNELSLTASEDDAELKSADINNAIVVRPEGPAFDTENLLNAFQEAADRSGRTLVQLTRGTYYLDRMVIQDFNGWFRGAGMYKTIIHPVPRGIHLPVTEPFEETEPFFITFSGGDILISDISIDINLDEPVEPYDWWTGGNVTFLTGVIRINGSSPENYTANSIIQRVSIKGRYVELYDFTPYNVDNAIIIGGGYNFRALGGRHIIRDCRMDVVETAMNSMGASNSELKFGGSPSHGNVIRNVNTGIFVMASVDSRFSIAYNQMKEVHAYAGVEVYQDQSWGPPYQLMDPGSSEFLIQGNSVELEGDYYQNVFTLQDLFPLSDPSKQSRFTVIGNKGNISLPNHCFLVTYAPNELKAINNRVTGEADIAFYVAGPSCGFKLLNNDVRGFTSNTADIFLDSESHENMVVTQEHTTVWDLGTDNSFHGNVELVTPALKKSAGKEVSKEPGHRYFQPDPH